ncbi:MAG TPA: hypothetical protein VFM88_15240 [Vicinamibacteria bacterium]|nr:hypothetical protein [Vicinamibacteria bacterium]
MTGKDRSVRIGSWLGPLGWAVALSLGLWVVFPVLRNDPMWFAWSVTLGVIVAALALLAARLRRHSVHLRQPERRVLGQMPGPRASQPTARVSGRRGPNWYKGRSHSGERPQFD